MKRVVALMLVCLLAAGVMPVATAADDTENLLPNGDFEVGVHIADVSHFVRPGTELDRVCGMTDNACNGCGLTVNR